MAELIFKFWYDSKPMTDWLNNDFLNHRSDLHRQIYLTVVSQSRFKYHRIIGLNGFEDLNSQPEILGFCDKDLMKNLHYNLYIKY